MQNDWRRLLSSLPTRLGGASVELSHSCTLSESSNSDQLRK